MSATHPPLAQVGKLINLIPVGLKEAALDSPTFRATTQHFGDQVELVEKWLEEYLRSAIRVVGEVGTLETILNSFMSHAMLPMNVSEAVVDHDYSVLAMRRYSESAKDFWASTFTLLKKTNVLVIEPIKSFLNNDLRGFKEAKKTLETNQRYYDSVQARYSSQAKAKEPSALREDAFQLHEARKAYLKSSMDFCVLAPQLRTALDKLMVQVFFDQWREMRASRDASLPSLSRSTQEMDRVKGWTREMEGSEKAFRRELQAARRQLEDIAESTARPSRELDDYSVSTTPYLGAAAMSLKSPKKTGPDKFEKQGWLNLRTYTGKPARTMWVRRWAFVKNGIFGWLIQSSRSGGVEESERIGVLLCNIRPAGQEERRFCFEIKTKKTAMMIQAETQNELSEWLSVFECAKQRALDDPASTDGILHGKTEINTDPAFSISPPPVPEFAATFNETLSPGGIEESYGVDRSNTLPVPGADISRESVDVAPTSRRSTMLDKEEGTRDHAARIISKLDLHRKGGSSSNLAPAPSTPTTGGIASLIAASHGSMPISPGVPVKAPENEPQKPKSTFTLALRDMPANSLAPSTLANPPAATSLSKAAVIVSGERGIGVGATGGMPGGMLANLWGSSNWGFVNRLERGEVKSQEVKPTRQLSLAPPRPSSPSKGRVVSLMKEASPGSASTTTLLPSEGPPSRDPSPPKIRHRQTISLDGDAAKLQRTIIAPQHFPNYYPLQLKTQDAQFRLLFPNVGREEKLVLVFRATWNPNDQQEFPGRAYVTTEDIYFYSNHLGLVLTTSVTLKSIAEVTAAPGRDCDFLFLHFREAKDGQPTRLTIKTFLENLKLLQKRLNFLIRNSDAEGQLDLEAVIKTLIKMEQEAPQRSPSLESWEDVASNTPMDELGGGATLRTPTDLKAPIRVDNSLNSHGGRAGQGKEVAKFKLPSQPVDYVPTGNLHLAAEKKFEVSPKALFHVLFGDKSAVWQLLQHERNAHDIRQGPWVSLDKGHFRREFEYIVDSSDLFGRTQKVDVRDYQVVDVMNDHLCYVVTDKRTAWHLPYKRHFRLVSKLVITHVAKSKSKLAIFTKVEWLHHPFILEGVITSQAMNDLSLAALDTVDLVSDQVRRLGPYSRTKKAVQIFGTIGQSTSTTQFSATDSVNQLNLEMRQIPRQRTLATLLLQTLGSLGESAITTVLVWTGGVMKWAWNTFSANRIILLLLFLSFLTNTFYTGRDRLEWWNERKATKFMRKVGVNPNNVMTKALYTSDIEQLISSNIPLTDTFNINTTTSSNTNVTDNLCFDTFYVDTANLGTDDTSTLLSRPSLSSRSASALKIHQTRRTLGTYRHDLLVAMRVVNSIEREMLKGEWEKWITEEMRRCEAVKGLIAREVEDDQEGGKEGEEVRRKYDEYCGSCEKAERRILESGLN
ncbi:putative transcription factor [Phaeomoniella chlamydospora]|uniref:Putative transcription factor n=1 Tax=Phaeomoniella chlamydospora TaxID=158046 RepID=A0A0G2DXD6_PHACM|nr:putative transcription factor [Phaeomoniella chlamydospora]